MAHPRDVTWLQLAGRDDLCLYVHGKLAQITRNLSSPNEQQPRVVHFIGRRQKHLALRCLFPSNNFGRWRKQCLASLRVEVTSATSASPLLVVDSDTTGHIELEPRYHYNNEFEKIPIRWSSSSISDADMNDRLQSQLIFPFSDVICIFVDDFFSFDEFIRRLLNISTYASFFSSVLPKLYLVTSQSKTQADFRCAITAEQFSVLKGVFALVEVFHLGSEALSPTARHRRLRETVFRQTMEQLDHRRRGHWNFSATHFSALFTAHARHFANTSSDAFDPVAEARLIAQPSTMTPHITSFIRTAGRYSMPRRAMIDLLSTAFFLNAYPSSMHAFDPKLMYHWYSMQLLSEVGYELNADIASAFTDLFFAWRSGSHPQQLRIDAMQRNSSWMTGFLTNNTCLFCLAQAPEHLLPCHHAVCDSCVRVFAEPLPTLEQRYQLRNCLICGSNQAKEMVLKPPTAGVRIISIDGGGTRGAVPLESLCILQDLLGRLPLRDCFDLALGTSSGGLIALAIFALHWEPKKCSEAFDTLSRKIFEPQKQSSSIASSLRKYVRYWISDGVYDHLSLEKCLQSIYGESSWLFGAPSCSSGTAKCAVTTSSIADGTTCLATSYNGDRTKGTQGYELLRPSETEHEPLIWQAARATSAAPVLFQSFTISELGAFQDGGLKHNNPSRIACWESRRIWPEIRSPDLFLSLGTGAPTRDRQKTPQFRNFLIDGFIPRLFRSCMAKADGEVMWTEFVNSLDDDMKKQYYRLNIPLEGVALIDDVDSMDQLRESVRSQPDSTRLAIVHNLLASCFFFQLEHQPHQSAGVYRVHGSIRCRVDPNKLLEAMTAAGLKDAEFTTDFETISHSPFTTKDICPKCQRFKMNVTFSVRNLQETLSIYLRSAITPQLKISGFPQQMGWFEEQQGYLDVFGSGVKLGPHCNTCAGVKRGPSSSFVERTRSKKMRLTRAKR